jgi:branched-chain amino acid transport system ATP-binding protein
MSDILGEDIYVFVGLTVIMIGGCALMMGQALASTWRPLWQLVPYGILLAIFGRFLAYALFGAVLLAPIPFLVVVALVLVLGGLGYRVTQANLMVRQYPWLYRRSGLFTWQELGRPAEAADNLADPPATL